MSKKKSKQWEEINTFNPEVPSSPEGPCGEKKMENYGVRFYIYKQMKYK